jgi:phage shock protein PspC (stress-responsive transcriptional regulator)
VEAATASAIVRGVVRSATGKTWPMAGLGDPRRALGGQGLVRPRRGKVLAGVCAGLAQRFGVGAGVVRLAFVLSLLLPGPQVLAYLALWVLMPREPR